MKSRRNKLAGKHPSYEKRKMSKASIEKKKMRDKNIASRPEQKKRRAESNKKRREAKQSGKDIRGMDYDHAVDRFVPTAKNRGRKEKSRKK
jgi:hypothetical protein